MRILVVSQYYYPEPFRINEVCEELVKRGHEVTVITSNPNYPEGNIYQGYKNINQSEMVNGVEVVRCKIRPRHNGNINLVLNYFSFVFSAITEVKRLKRKKYVFDLIYVYQLSPVTCAIPAIRAKKKFNAPVLLYCLDIWPESVLNVLNPKGVSFSLVKKMSWAIYNKVDRIAVTSPCFVEYLNNVCKVKKEVMETIPQHSVDIMDSGIENWKREDNGGFYFLFMGNIGESQNIECILRAVQMIPSDIQFRVHIVGSGSCLQKSMELCSKIGVDNRVIFHGRQPKSRLSIYYSQADVCLLTLRNEGVVGWTIPGKLQEYMSAGKPVIAAIDGDSRKVIEDAKCGYCVSANDSEGLAKLMTFVISHNETLGSLSSNARSYYEKNYTLNRHVNLLEETIKKVIIIKKKED